MKIFSTVYICLALFIHSAAAQGLIIHKQASLKDTVIINTIDSLTFTQSLRVHKNTGTTDSTSLSIIDSLTFDFSIKSKPVISSLSPASVYANSGAFTLDVQGNHFSATSVVKWNGTALTTTYVSSTELTAAVPAGNITSAGSATITVYTPTPGGGTSGSLSSVILPILLESFETGTKPSYAAADVVLSSGTWNLSASLLGSTAADRKTGNQSIRMRDTGVVTMKFDYQYGASSVSVLHAKYGNDTSSAWQLYYSTNAGTSWVQAGSDVRSTDTNLTSASFPINLSGNIRFKLVKKNYNSMRINFDDFTIYSYSASSPAPSISSLSPASCNAGVSNFTLTVNGSGFVSTSLIKWNGTALTTTYISATQLQATVPAANVISAGSATVTVYTPAPGGGTTSGLSFTINAVSNPVPVLSSMSPTTCVAGASSFTLTVNGSNFISTSVINWNGSALTTTYLSSTQLQATISAANVSSAGTASVTVTTPTPGGGTTSGSTFTITTNPAPTLTSISPTSCAAGSSGFTITATGSSFVSSSVIKWNGTALTTTYVSATQLQATVPAGNVTSAGTATVTVYTGTPGGGTSTGQTFTINSSSNPAPTLTSISPTSCSAGSSGFTITATGSSFVSSSVIKWNGTALTTTYVSATQLQASVPAGNVTSTGTATVTVYTGTPGGGTSSSQTFTISSAVAQSSNINLTMGNPSNAIRDVNTPANFLIERGQYCLSYNRDRGIPNWVSWELDNSWLGSASRGSFKTDTLPAGWTAVTTGDYLNSGFSRGHMCPSADRTVTEADNDSVFFMTNIIPQTQANNGGPWEVLETYCRNLATAGNKLYIISGPYGTGGTGLNGYMTSLPNNANVAVPAKTWKVILVLPAGTNDVSRVTTSTRCIGVVMNNDLGPFTNWWDYRVSVRSIETLTGYNFFSNVPQSIQDAIETAVDAGPTN